MLPLSALGDRVCIMGPSNSGKSTLADAIARKLHTEAIHLDRLYHLPGTDWQPRPFADFQALHAAATRTPRWIMDGNYSRLLPERLARATGFILLDISTPLSLFRFIRRTLVQGGRIGALEGAPERVHWTMLRHIAITTRGNRRRYAELLQTIPLPTVQLMSAAAIRSCYAEWQLRR